MRQQSNKLRQILGPVIEAMGYELVGVEFHPGRGNALLRIYIDQGTGVDTADCQRVSQQISGVLDVEDPIAGPYTLEVSSPGLDRPLFDAEHFARFAGRQVTVQLAVPLQGRKKLIGLLRGTREHHVVVEVDGEERLVPLEYIDKARLVPEL